MSGYDAVVLGHSEIAYLPYLPDLVRMPRVACANLGSVPDYVVEELAELPFAIVGWSDARGPKRYENLEHLAALQIGANYEVEGLVRTLERIPRRYTLILAGSIHPVTVWAIARRTQRVAAVLTSQPGSGTYGYVTGIPVIFCSVGPYGFTDVVLAWDGGRFFVESVRQGLVTGHTPRDFAVDRMLAGLQQTDAALVGRLGRETTDRCPDLALPKGVRRRGEFEGTGMGVSGR